MKRVSCPYCKVVFIVKGLYADGQHKPDCKAQKQADQFGEELAQMLHWANGVDNKIKQGG